MDATCADDCNNVATSSLMISTGPFLAIESLAQEVLVSYGMTVRVAEEAGHVRGPELFFGLVAAVGTDLELVIKLLSESLEKVNYQPSPAIRLATLLRELQQYKHLRTKYLDDYINDHMTAGDELRKNTGKNDIMVLLGLSEVTEERNEWNRARQSSETTIPRRAYILRSLKHPEESRTLRNVYGKAFYLISAYAPHQERTVRLARGIADTRSEFAIESHLPEAEALIRRDQEELGLMHGQNLRDTFHRADVFVDASNEVRLRESLDRFVELLFGNTFHTPTKAEYAMFHARAAALRSAELGRQVGAAIARDDGDIVAVGTNEVPKAGGGLYWCGDDPDKREFRQGHDSNSEHKRNLFSDTLQHLQRAGWLNNENAEADVRDLVKRAFDVEKPVLPPGSQFRNLIEFGRAVHAEMAALMDAARRGIPVAGCTLYVTTFPCHMCARHIVAAGIKRVIYIEPYAKSLAAELYPDSIAVESDTRGKQVLFEPFVGVAPRQYMDLFAGGRRCDIEGRMIPFVPADASPRYFGSERVYLDNEKEQLTILRNVMNRQGILFD